MAACAAGAACAVGACAATTAQAADADEEGRRIAYAPPNNRVESLAEQHAMIRANSFGLLACALDGTDAGPQLHASHLPFVLDAERGPLGTLIVHVARNNPLWQDLEMRGEATVIFSGPHHYISPRWDGAMVPTWDFEAVYVRASVRVLGDEESAAALGALIEQSESKLAAEADDSAAEPGGWTAGGVPESELRGLRRHIMAMELTITQLEAKRKMGQNRAPLLRRLCGSALARVLSHSQLK